MLSFAAQAAPIPKIVKTGWRKKQNRKNPRHPTVATSSFSYRLRADGPVDPYQGIARRLHLLSDPSTQAKPEPKEVAVKPLGDRKRHYWLAQRMAKTTGPNLVSAYDQGALDQQEWAQMVQNCRGCTWTEGCERWLLGRESSASVPESCANCAWFSDLQTQDSAKGSERT